MYNVTMLQSKSHCSGQKYVIYCQEAQIYHYYCNVFVCFVQNAITEVKYRPSFKTSLVREETKSKGSTKNYIIVLKLGLPKFYVPVLKMLFVLC